MVIEASTLSSMLNSTAMVISQLPSMPTPVLAQTSIIDCLEVCILVTVSFSQGAGRMGGE